MLRTIIANTRVVKNKVFGTAPTLRSISTAATKSIGGLFGQSKQRSAPQSTMLQVRGQKASLLMACNSFNGWLAIRSYAAKAKSESNAASKASVVASPVVGFAQVAQVQIPHPEKAAKGGEDACFISNDQSVIAVFGGVGGSAGYMIDPRDFAVKLAEGGKRAADNNIRDPSHIMAAGLEETKTLRGGSSTACVAVLNGNNVHMANLGDSGMFIIRPPKTTVFRSREQQARFNCPYQLPHTSLKLARLEKVPVQEGDVVILATDGVFDNIFNDEMLELVKNTVEANKGANDLAQKLVTDISDAASKAANNTEKESPFEQAVIREFGSHEFRGGKLDDITVVVGIVGKVEAASKNDKKDKAEVPKKEKGKKATTTAK